MKMSALKNPRGFTLVELLIAMVILGVSSPGWCECSAIPAITIRPRK
jgi:prepilin-type N-terminal cleavage/methylation domain-containing protein